MNFSIRILILSTTRLGPTEFRNIVPSSMTCLCIALISRAIACESKPRKGPANIK